MLAKLLNYHLLFLADGALFEVEPFGYLKVGEILSHEDEEVLLIRSEGLGEVVEDFADFIGIGCGQMVEEPLVGRGKCYFTVAVGEDAAALPYNPCGFLKLCHIGAQRVKVLPNCEITLLHKVIAQDFVTRRTPPAELAYQPAVPPNQQLEVVVSSPVICHAKGFLPI